ncbi:MAG TPA: ABC transporter ATP-binding protein [Gemmatimonadales bacterium]|nr:ABC transporter ATP-binding protein [Gemmatimonadales bacterium]
MSGLATVVQDMRVRSGPTTPPGPIVEIEGLGKRFGRRTVLHGITCAFGRGRVTAVLGPNAAGKSTLIKVLLGLVCPDAGRVTIDGMVIGSDPSYRRGIGYMPQEARFPENLTGRKVLAMLRDLRGAATPVDTTLLEGFQLDAELDKPLRTLSGGTRQKLNAAIAFLFLPRLLILDEPTAGLDPLASGYLKDRVADARAGGASVILTSHVMAEVEEMVDDVVFLLEGRLRFRGALHELRAHTGETRLERAIARLMREAAC